MALSTRLESYLYTIRCLIVLAIGILLMSSCSAQEDLLPPDDPAAAELNSDDYIYVNFSISTREELSTRASVTVDDIPEPVDCDKLWFAVYYNEQLLYDCNDVYAPIPIKIGNRFVFIEKFSKSLDPTKIEIFFWAGRSTDNVVTNDNLDFEDHYDLSDGYILLNFAKRYVQVNGQDLLDNKHLIHSYTNYIQLSETSDLSSCDKNIVLKRPFSSYTILRSDIDKNLYPEGIDMRVRFGDSDITHGSGIPHKWFFDDEIEPEKPWYGPQDRLITGSYGWTIHSDLNEVNYSVNGSQRKYVNCGTVYYFAPFFNKSFAYGTDSNGNILHTRNHVHASYYNSANGQYLGGLYLIVPLPEEGIQSNNKYIIIK